MFTVQENPEEDLLPEELQLRELVSSNAIADLDVEIHNVVKGIETFEGLVVLESRLRNYIDNGERIHPATLVLYKVAHETFLRSGPIKFRKKHLALESFNLTARPLQALIITQESLVDTIKEYAKKFAEYLVSIWKRIMTLLEGVFSRKDILEGNAKRLAELVDNIPDHVKPIEEYITSRTVVTEDHAGHKEAFLENNILFAINGQCDGRSVLEILENTITLLDANRAIIADMARCMQFIVESNPSVDDIKVKAKHLVDTVKAKMEHFKTTQRKTEGHQVYRTYGYFHDSYFFQLREDIGKRYEHDQARFFNIDLDIVKKKEEEYRVKVLTKEEMEKVGKKTLELIAKSRDFDKVIPIADKAVTKTAHTLHSLFMDFSEESEKQSVKASLQLVKEVFYYVKRYLPRVSQAANTVAGDASTYVRTSASRYKMQ